MQRQPVNAPMSDKTFIRTMATSIIGIVLCMIALLSTTWAYLSQSVDSQSNVIQAGNFVIDPPTITQLSGSSTQMLSTAAVSETDLAFKPVKPNGRNAYEFEVPESQTVMNYQIEIGVESLTVKEGCCTVTVRSNDTSKKYYHKFTNENSGPFSFEISAVADETIEIVAYWSAYGDVLTGADTFPPDGKIETTGAKNQVDKARALQKEVTKLAENVLEDADRVNDIVGEAESLAGGVPVVASDSINSSVDDLIKAVQDAQEIRNDMNELSNDVKNVQDSIADLAQTANVVKLQGVQSYLKAMNSKVVEAEGTASAAVENIRALVNRILAAMEAAAQSTVVSIAESTVVEEWPQYTPSTPVISESTVVPASPKTQQITIVETTVVGTMPANP